MNLHSLEKFIKTLDACTAKDETRASLCAIHELAVMGEQTRLCATDCQILAVVDVPTDLIAYACKQFWLHKRETAGQVCYVTHAKRELTAETVYPYPDIMRVIPDLKPLTEPSQKIFSFDIMKKYAVLRDLYQDSKAGKTNNFIPNYGVKSLISASVYVDEGFFCLLMPCAAKAPEIRSINYYLPGFLPEPAIPEDTLSEWTIDTESPESPNIPTNEGH